MRTSLLISAALALAAATGPAAAGSVEVKFTEPDKFADIGRTSRDQEQALAALRAHFESLGKRMPDSHKLSIEVTDVDLAGEPEWARSRPELRVLRGRADWPRIELRYALSDGTRALRQGSQQVIDMGYLQSTPGKAGMEPLYYERRMIERWFSETIASQ